MPAGPALAALPDTNPEPPAPALLPPPQPERFVFASMSTSDPTAI